MTTLTASLIPTSVLDAVNTCLAAIGESPVSTADTTDLVSVALAKQFLAERSLALQAMSWKFNSDENYTLALDADSKIPVPVNTLRVTAGARYKQYDLVQRAGFLYDRVARSFTFSTPIEVNITWYYDFEDLPQAARWFITVSAARTLQARILGSDSRARFTEDDELRAWATFTDAEAETGSFNMFRDSYSVSQTLQRFPDGVGYPVFVA